VKNAEKVLLDFEVDKLTNSIENAITGEVFDTDIIEMKASDLKQLKKADWQFDWHKELKKENRRVYKLVTFNNPKIVHGLISIEDCSDHFFMHLIESAKFNKGRAKVYRGVPGNLVSFGCKAAFEKGYGGVVAFVAKSQLIGHYKLALGAKLIGGNKMYLDTKEALIIVKQYFKNFEL
jgi:hypothetical protein